MSWIPYDAATTDFPIQNIPFGVFSTASEPAPRCATRIGDTVVDLSKLAHLFTGPALSGSTSVFVQVCLIYREPFFSELGACV